MAYQVWCWFCPAHWVTLHIEPVSHHRQSLMSQDGAALGAAGVAGGALAAKAKGGREEEARGGIGTAPAAGNVSPSGGIAAPLSTSGTAKPTGGSWAKPAAAGAAGLAAGGAAAGLVSSRLFSCTACLKA